MSPGTLRSLSIGGATYDLFLAFDESVHTAESISFHAGGKTPIKRVVEACGGGAANSSVGLSRLGTQASFAGILGSDQWGEIMLRNLKQEGVDTLSATIVDHETSSFSVILSTETDRSILYAAGVNAHLHDVTFDTDAVKNADIVYLNHLTEDSCEIEHDIVRMLAESKALLTWNPGGCQIEAGMDAPDKAGLLKRAHLLLLNKEEALKFSGTSSIDEAMRRLIGVGAKNVCITDGKNGVIASDGVNRYHCPILPVTIVDTTGAGDAFGVGVTWALAGGQSLQSALQAGTLNAASVVGTIGSQAGLLTQTEIRKRMEQSSLSVSVHPLSPTPNS